MWLAVDNDSDGVAKPGRENSACSFCKSDVKNSIRSGSLECFVGWNRK